MAQINNETESPEVIRRKYYKDAITPGKARDKREVYGMTPNNYSKMLHEFTKIHTKKELLISVKPIATWISSGFAGEVAKELSKFFKSDTIKAGQVEWENKEPYAYSQGSIYYRGISQEPGAPAPEIDLGISGTYDSIRQRDHNGLLQHNGFDVEFAPTNYNRLCSFKFEDKELQMPYFYKSPNQEIESLEWALDETRGTKRKLYKAAMSHNGHADLAIISETDTKITYNIMSYAGLYFIKEVLTKHIKTAPKDWEKFVKDEAYRELAERLMITRNYAVNECRQRVVSATRTMTVSQRELTSAELVVKNTDTASIIKEMIARIQKEAKQYKFIKQIYIDFSGQFVGVMGPLKMKGYISKLDNIKFIDKRDYDSMYPENKEELEIDMGLVSIQLNNANPFILNNTGPLKHPHVYPDGRLCMGNGSSIYATLLGKLEIVSTLRLVFSLLEKYNPGSPVVRINDIGYFDEKREENAEIFPEAENNIYLRKD